MRCDVSLALKDWRIPGELLALSLHWEPEEVGFSAGAKGQVNLPARVRQGHQSKASFFHVLLCKLSLKGAAHI